MSNKKFRWTEYFLMYATKNICINLIQIFYIDTKNILYGQQKYFI